MLFEPALTNVGIVLPEPGYLDAVRELTRRPGTLLVIDETHTICAGPGGDTGAYGLEPDLLVDRQDDRRRDPVGGLRVQRGGRRAGPTGVDRPRGRDVGGIGGTLAGYALSLAGDPGDAAEVLTDEAFERMIPLAERWEAGVAGSSATATSPGT